MSNVTTPDIEAKLATALAAVTDAQRMVAEQNVQHANEVLLLKAAGADLQKQLDAARARIAELEGQQQEPEPPVDPPRPTLTVTAEATGLRVAWTDATRIVVIPTRGRHMTPCTLPVASPTGESEVPYTALSELWDEFGPGWELSAWAESGSVTGDEVHVTVPRADEPADPPAPPVGQPPGQSHVPPIPANAVYATSVAHAVQLRDESRRSGQPFVVRGLKIDSAMLPDRQLSLDGCKGPVWILDNDWSGDSKGFAAHQSPLFWDNERGIYIAGNTFRDMPKTCVIFAYGPQDCVIEGNRFENVHQPIHLILRESADANLTIAGNVGRGISRIAVEIQSSGFGYGAGQRVYETRGVRLIGNDMHCAVGGEIVYSLACPSARDMLVQGNTARQPVKGSAEDADKSHGGIGYSFELMAGILDGNRAIGSRIGYCLEGDMAPWGVTVKANNVYQGPGSRIGYQNRGERNPKHVIE